ncbi:inactive transglutaminase family protein [Thalassotalea ponticola]|uniref:inactive transglutaminase family protein n=1 Tax=Thalassotalea ponticola TaxID=1523392 RepID=UPI0025B5BAA3|nr:inactive transglutaminase family protein [Thalassotalea ponticola]MDN3653746.1 inactive transglutaminase family protein [Thalassotalea ponticola]
MTSRKPFLLLVGLLFIVGISSIYHRHTKMGVPLTPGEQIDIWQIEAEIEFTATGNPVTAKLTLPKDNRFTLVDEFTASPGYGMHISREEKAPSVTWSKREAEGKQRLYYQASVKRAIDPAPQPAPTGSKDVEVLTEPLQSSLNDLFKKIFSRSGDNASLVMQARQALNSDDQDVAILKSSHSKSSIFTKLMLMAEIPTQMVRGLVLEDGRRKQSLIPLVQIYFDEQWHLLDIESDVFDDELPVLVWQQGAPSLLDVVGGRNSKVQFSISKTTTSAVIEANNAATKGDFFDFGLYQLPLAEQNLFKGILLLPIGALVVVFLRVIIGLKCSGTFMPILIATSFIQTELLNGVIGFLLIVSAGLLIRSYLSHLNLLLVSRISAVVIVVIGIITVFTVFAFRMGLTEALTITFFPMIIMAWTIERMSILWEEEGGKEVLIQGSGSMIVAVVAYLLMDNYLIRHWAFNFLGVHAIVMALILMMGQYTGYRLLELRRFRPMAEDTP